MPNPLESVKQLWSILNFYPEFHDQKTADRTNRFIMESDAEGLYKMQCDLFTFATPYFLEDERIAGIMRDFDGRRVGLGIKRVYESTITFRHDGFEHGIGLGRGYPVFMVSSRKAYSDGVLRRVDPLQLILSRRIKVSNVHVLALWALPHLGILGDRDLFDKFLGYQDLVEDWIRDELTELGF